MGIRYQYHGHGYEIRSTSIGQFFADYGNSYTKHIPREFLTYGPDLLQRLFDGLMYGDGHKTESNGYVFATGSKQLGDDLMELATKLGLVATVSVRPAGRMARFLGRIVNAAKTYVVSISQPKRKYGLIKKEHIKKTRANGKVYCVTVENHTVFARRNGKAIWAGNTEWSLQRHVVPAFPIPDNWKLAMSWDDGTRAPRAVYVWAVDNDKHVWGIYEYYRKDEALLDAARNIKDELVKLGYWDRIEYLVVDPSMKKSDGNTSSVETLERLGFGFKRGEIILANNDRKEGWRVMRMYLSHKPYEEPMLKVFSHCSNLIRTLPEQIFYDGGTMGKREDLDTRGEDHAADSARYFLMTLTDSPLRLGGSSEFRLARREYRTKSSLIT